MPFPSSRPVRRVLAGVASVLVSAALPATAAAVVPPAATVNLPVISTPAFGGPTSIGTATLNVTYTDTHATAKASSPSVKLGPGHVFSVSTCLRMQVVGAHIDSSCRERVVDTRAKTSAAHYWVPELSKTAPRPAVGGVGGAVYLVSVRAQSSSGLVEAATSWPAAGVAAAQIALPPLDAVLGTKLPTQGLSLAWSSQTGGINTGLRDSFCASEHHPLRTPAADDVSTTALGAAPEYYEVGEPTGDHAGAAPKGVMIILNGGGWYRHGAGGVESNRSVADRWRALGWRTLNATYRPCSDSFADVRSLYRRAREVWGTTLPYCAQGSSAGGHLALLLAASESTLACAINREGPTNGLSIGSQSAWSSTGPQKSGPAWVYNLMTAAWGKDMLTWHSPAIHPIKARVLMGVAAQDPYVPWAQAIELRDRMRARSATAYVDIAQLAAGAVPWDHAGVSQAADDDFRQRELALVAPLVTQ